MERGPLATDREDGFARIGQMQFFGRMDRADGDVLVGVEERERFFQTLELGASIARQRVDVEARDQR